MALSLPHLPHIGSLPSGAHDCLADVGHVTVGHTTLAPGEDTDVQTGVTVICPHAGNVFCHKVPAAVYVINGFGKSLGLVQLQELGQLETPIALTNTLSVPALAQAQIRACMTANPEMGRSLPTVNPLVLECNDGFLNDIQRMAVTEAHYTQALASAAPRFAQGSVGAGRGMSCFQLKGGIGSASRVAGNGYVVAALVLANFGLLPQLRWGGEPLGARLAAYASLFSPPLAGEGWGLGREHATEQGSIIMVLATDAPLCSRQLGRLARRAAAGLARTGSCYGHGSGDIALAFSTAYTLPADAQATMPTVTLLHESLLDPLFQAAADSVEQAILHALWQADTVSGREGHQRQGLRQLFNILPPV